MTDITDVEGSCLIVAHAYGGPGSIRANETTEAFGAFLLCGEEKGEFLAGLRSKIGELQEVKEERESADERRPDLEGEYTFDGSGTWSDHFKTAT
jgi:hypothetical protein